MKPAAHSPPSTKLHNEPHSYADHIAEMLKYGVPQAIDMLKYASMSGPQRQAFLDTIVAAIMLHDMGKLDELNQPVLQGHLRSALAIDHIEAGEAVAYELENQLLAWIIRGHHAPGLPSYDAEEGFAETLELDTELKLGDKPHLRGLRRNRDSHLNEDTLAKHVKAVLHTNTKLDFYKALQIKECGPYPELGLKLPNSALATRLSLSCLVDPDHESAAVYEKGDIMPEYFPPNGRWRERILKLDAYISDVVSKSMEPNSHRNKLRAEFYGVCAYGPLLNDNIVACSAPVGLGKTTSVLAYLLRQAERSQLRRIFVIAPFTNVINQTVKTLRKSLTLHEEDSEQIVVAHHHKADFADKSLRQYTVLWKAPVVVTTAVQFFETLASADPSGLRKLNSLVGSAIFIDESHACLPPILLRVAWKWLKELADDWGCKIVLASGSLVEFWKKAVFVDDRHISQLPDLINTGIKQEAHTLELSRVCFKQLTEPQKLGDLVEVLMNCGTQLQHNAGFRPCILVIMNTVQSAAVVACSLAESLKAQNDEKLTDRAVLHLSTALAPEHRDIILAEVESRHFAGSNWADKTWYLIATSCVEAGVDLDFAVGYRERCCVTSFLQVAGRINRHAIRELGYLFDFVTLQDHDGLNHHPGFDDSKEVFLELWPELQIGNIDLSLLATRSMTREMKPGRIKESEELLQHDDCRNFQEVMQNFKVIDSDTKMVIIDRLLASKIEQGIPISWQDIQNKSIQLWSSRLSQLQQEGYLSPVKGIKHELYVWNAGYDCDFLGFMAGLLATREFFKHQYGVI